jgi:hypothetical protein
VPIMANGSCQEGSRCRSGCRCAKEVTSGNGSRGGLPESQAQFNGGAANEDALLKSAGVTVERKVK